MISTFYFLQIQDFQNLFWGFSQENDVVIDIPFFSQNLTEGWKKVSIRANPPNCPPVRAFFTKRRGHLAPSLFCYRKKKVFYKKKNPNFFRLRRNKRGQLTRIPLINFLIFKLLSLVKSQDFVVENSFHYNSIFSKHEIFL